MPAKGSTAEQRFAARMAQRNAPRVRTTNIHIQRAEHLAQRLTAILLDHRDALVVPRSVLEQSLTVANYVRTRPHVV
jgi:hypothetical protein